MNDDLLVSWTPVTLDIGGQPANVAGYRVYDMNGGQTLLADVPSGPTTIVGHIVDPNEAYPVAVAAYNAVGEGPLSTAVITSPPTQSVPEMVQGVTATIIPK